MRDKPIWGAMLSSVSRQAGLRGPNVSSICSSPLQKGYLEITVKRTEGGVVSTFLHERVNVGLTVEAWGPSGQFCFDESQHQRAVLIAGGQLQGGAGSSTIGGLLSTIRGPKPGSDRDNARLVGAGGADRGGTSS